MEKRHSPDTILLALSATIIVFGILILGSVSSSFSLEQTGTTFYYFIHQIILGLLPGILFALCAYLAPLEKIKKTSFVLLIINIALLIAVFLPVIGGSVKGAYRWIGIGAFSFQPSEILKVTFILYAAAWISSRMGKKKKEIMALLPFFSILGLIGLLLVLQRDVSTLLIIAAVGVIIYFLAETPFKHLFLIGGAGISLLLLMIRLAPYRFNRLLVFLHPNLDPLGKGYHINQALIGIGSGGLTGVGLGLSFQKFGTLPEPMSDSIFAIFAEEMGLIGTVLLIALFLLFMWRAFIIAKRIPDNFQRLTAMGIASWITIQALINIGSMVGIFPVAGIPLPFISYGGSALFSELIGLGILLNISKQKI